MFEVTLFLHYSIHKTYQKAHSHKDPGLKKNLVILTQIILKNSLGDVDTNKITRIG